MWEEVVGRTAETATWDGVGSSSSSDVSELTSPHPIPFTDLRPLPTGPDPARRVRKGQGLYVDPLLPLPG